MKTVYDIEYLKADYVIVDVVAVGTNQTKCVLREQASVSPYDAKTIQIVSTNPNAFLTSIRVALVIKEVDPRTAQIVNVLRPMEFQFDFEIMPNHKVISNLTGNVSAWSEEDAYLAYLTQSIELEVQKRGLLKQGTPFYHMYVETPEMDSSLTAPVIFMELPYLKALAEHVKEYG